MSTNPFLAYKWGRLYTRIRRPLDYLYILFFLVHLLASVLIDAQVFLPTHLFPPLLQSTKSTYLLKSQDPLLTNVHTSRSLVWFKTCILLELLFQVPTFCFGIYHLFRDRPSHYAKVYPTLIAYATLASTTTLLCLVQALRGGNEMSTSSLTDENKAQIRLAYGPFLLVPGIMLIDMLVRCNILLSTPYKGATEGQEENLQSAEMQRDKKRN